MKFVKLPIVAGVMALAAVGGMAIASAAPASAATAGAGTAPAPECISFSLSPTGELCVPQAWLTVTNVITNSALLSLDTVQFANNSSTPSNVSQTETVSGMLEAGVTGTIGFSSTYDGITAMGEVSPSVKASVTASVAVDGQASVPPQCVGNLYFGIHYVLDNVQVYSRNIYGQVTSSPQVAWAPTLVGYSDGFQVPNPGPNPPNPACAQAAATQPLVPNILQFAEAVLAGPSALAQPPVG